MRVKLGRFNAGTPEEGLDQVSVPSDLSQNDLWGEIPKYMALKDKEKKLKEQEAFMKKRNEVRSTLEKQLMEQQKMRDLRKQ